MKNVRVVLDESGLECPGCGSPDWSRAKGLDAVEGRRLHAFYTCERRSCDGRFRVAFAGGRRVEVVLMWSDWPGAIERARARASAPPAPEAPEAIVCIEAGEPACTQTPEPACLQASSWPAARSYREGITLF